MGLFTNNGTKLRHWMSPECVLCGLPRQRLAEHAACDGCLADLPLTVASDVCPQCGQAGSGGATCGRCLKHPPEFTRTFAALDYRFPADAVLQRYKYAGDFSLTPLLAFALTQRLATAPRVDMILVAPLAATRLRERGFNQVLELAKPVARALAIKLEAHALTKPKGTAHQAELPFKARKANIRGAFACAIKLPKRVAIVDDVMTTGATMNELAKVARAAGAEDVSAWVLLRTQPRDLASGRLKLSVDTQDDV